MWVLVTVLAVATLYGWFGWWLDARSLNRRIRRLERLNRQLAAQVDRDKRIHARLYGLDDDDSAWHPPGRGGVERIDPEQNEVWRREHGIRERY